MQPRKIMLPIAGVWLRKFEEDPLGDETGADLSTLVFWTQSARSGLYVDIRLPLGSPGRSIEEAQKAGIVPRPSAITANGFSDDAKERLQQQKSLVDIILRQKSFAGQIIYKVGDTTSSGEAVKKDQILAKLAAERETDSKGLSLCTCFWRRDIDYQPPSGGLDVGVCASEQGADDGSVLLRETGDDASYAEGWFRLPHTDKGPFMALELLEEDGKAGCRVGFWVRAGARFAYAIGRPGTFEAESALKIYKGSHSISSCVGQMLSEAVSSMSENPSEMLDIAGSYLCACGKINSEQTWIINHSTNPELVGCSIVGNLEKQNLCCSQITPTDENSKEVEQVLAGGLKRRWRIVELDRCSLPIV